MYKRPAFAFCVLGLLTMLACDRPATETPPPPKATDAPVTARTAPDVVATPATIGGAGESVVAEFNRRVRDYVALREQLAGTLKGVPDRAAPREIDAHQRALLALVAKARPDAKAGDIFVPEMQTFVRGLMKRVLDGPNGAKVRESLMDENPVGAKVEVNGRYPDTVPMSTMPPDVLAALPALPDEMEYRFVGDRLILLDVKAHLIVDYVTNTIAREE